jgi:superoxide reductase
MPQKMEIFRCDVCRNMVEVTHGGQGELVCCGQPMEQLTPKTQDQGHEKHVPVIDRREDGYVVRVGANPHPMEPDHHIEWIELVLGDQVLRQQLEPGGPAEAFFPTAVRGVDIWAREYCNVHGLWSG